MEYLSSLSPFGSPVRLAKDSGSQTPARQE
jgi:hypothetical protein